MITFQKLFIILFFVLIFTGVLKAQNIGFIDVYNGGGFMVQFSITYSLSGQDYTRSTGSFPLGQSKSIITPFGATNLRLNVQYLVFIGVWSDLIVLNLPSTNRCFGVYGTIFYPTWSGIDC